MKEDAWKKLGELLTEQSKGPTMDDYEAIIVDGVFTGRFICGWCKQEVPSGIFNMIGHNRSCPNRLQ